MSALDRSSHVVRTAFPPLFLIAWLVTACGGGDSSGTPAPVATVTVTPNPATVTAGSTLQLTATLEDADGNELAGIRSVELQVPIGTYTGWALRRAPFAEGEDCALTGQFIPFARTRAERLASGDPRPSLEERYPTHADYVAKVVGWTLLGHPVSKDDVADQVVLYCRSDSMTGQNIVMDSGRF